MIPVSTTNLDIFPIPFTVVNFGEASRELNREMVEMIYDAREKNPTPVQKSNIGIWQNSGDLCNSYPKFKEIEKIFLEAAKPAIARAGLQGNLDEQLDLNGIYANINDKAYASHLPHIHGFGDSIFIGVYYPSSGILNGKHVSDNQDLNQAPNIYASSRPNPGDIMFIDPAANTKKQVISSNMKRYPYYSLDMCVTPREGLLLLAPHYMSHLVTPTEKDNFDRISISFDVRLKVRGNLV